MADGVAAPRTDMEKVQTSPMGEAPYAALLQKIRDLELAICEEVEWMLELRKHDKAVESIVLPEDAIAIRKS